ncbi:DUF6482 family protein [Pseudomonas syringae pv. actinidiae]|uniref:Cation transporter n=6 Tax=Pseudomonas syringae group TaxID=136849 RepID=A0A656K294_PSESF|nr:MULTISPECIES: DUF6482 family protein [Pseudomonas syringae group]EPM97662.1 hypothetical protein A259_30722 [Pseudomonas syringae pv. actinidiae ICMP 19070]EPN65467.1 hypothetical protein A245_08069 [Pseudomonas syringae pv. actinidiae ICMP 19096]EPN67678.1 hypothetical protein A234_28261 [Pseudomonas syringae pv. actinidiae ICMP 19101]EPN69103.1 hypothetical protein A235_07167 [Pseudomonas syringae pv. actinidiae ICMP 19079]POD80958.1 cation transporter [Pseudomonas syringae group genomosp
MTLNIQDLTKHVKDKKVDELDLISMEGGSYVLHALVDGKSVPVQDSTGKPLHVASLEEARKVLSAVPDVKLFMTQAVAHDEMVGLDSVQPESSRHEIPLRSSL